MKLNVHGMESHLLQDKLSQRVLCESICVIVEFDVEFVMSTLGAVNAFLAEGCPGGSGGDSALHGEHPKFVKVVSTVGYHMLCKA